jgi:cytochrome c-type biogenesis protein CcmH/NrfG
VCIGLAALWLAGCAGNNGEGAEWPDTAKRWYDRAEASYRGADIEDAELAINNALRVLPDEPDVMLLAAGIALAKLE